MFPGTTTKVSEQLTFALAATVNPRADLIHVTDTSTTTVLTTINGQFGGGFSGLMIIVNRSGGAITTVTTGNIAAAVTVPENLSCVFTFSKGTGKWYPGAIS